MLMRLQEAASYSSPQSADSEDTSSLPDSHSVEGGPTNQEQAQESTI